MRNMILLLLAVCFAAPSDQESLRALARKHGHIAKAILTEYPPATFADLVKQSDLVARVVVVKHRAALSSDETTVSTTYTAQLLDVVHARGRAPLTGGDIEIARPGGSVILDGYTVNVHESDFPPFELGDEYILFLSGVGGQYRVAQGAQGAFKVHEGLAEQLSLNNGAIKELMPRLPVARLRTEVQTAAVGKQ